MDAHQSRVWALAGTLNWFMAMPGVWKFTALDTQFVYLVGNVVKSDDSLLASGAGDSALILWKDVTKEEREAAAAEKEKRILEEQQLANLMQQGLLMEALALAIRLDQPFRCLNILKG